MRSYRYMADLYEGDQEPDLALYANYGHTCVALKASEGVTHADTTHAGRSRQAHAHGLTVVHYHYCKPSSQNSVGVEAAFFWRWVKPVWQPGDYLALDVEELSPHGARATGEYTEMMVEHVHRVSGHTPLVYGSTSFLEMIGNTAYLKTVRRWQAQYGSMPGWGPWRRPWWAWQFTDGTVGPGPHRCAGIPRGDISLLNWRTAVVLRSRFRRRRRRLKHG